MRQRVNICKYIRWGENNTFILEIWIQDAIQHMQKNQNVLLVVNYLIIIMFVYFYNISTIVYKSKYITESSCKLKTILFF